MTSLRKIATCIGLPANFSLVRDFFGHQQMPDTLLAEAVTGNGMYSLRDQVLILNSFHIHVNLILVGVKDVTSVEDFSHSVWGDMDMAVFALRSIYAKVGLGIGRVRWFAIPLADAGGYECVESDDEAEALTNSWSVHNNGLDVFIIRTGWSDEERQRLGISVAGASCNKDSKGLSGSVVSLSGPNFTLPHEMGHDLGLHHIGGLEIEDILAIGNLSVLPESLRKNLMFPYEVYPRVTLNSEQGDIMKTHCLMQPGCLFFP